MYEVDSFWQCEVCGYSNAGLDRCIMCNTRGPLDKKPTLEAVTDEAEVGGEAGSLGHGETDEEPLINVAEWRRASYRGTTTTKAGRRQNRKRATKTMVGIVLLNIAWQIGVAIWASGSDLDGMALAKFLLLTNLAFFGLIALYVLGRAAEIGVRPRWVQDGRVAGALEGLAVGGIMAVVVTLLVRAVSGRTLVDEGLVGLAADGTVSLILLGGLVIVLLGPVVEELVFRGFMAETFRSRGVWVAAAASGLAFACAHLLLFGIPYFFVMGVIFALLYFHRGLLSSFSAHATFNGMLLVIALIVVNGPPTRVTTNGSTATLPGHWQVEEESTRGVSAVGPLGARFELMYEETEGPIAAPHLALGLSAAESDMAARGIVIDPASVAVTQIPAGQAVTFTAEVYGEKGEAVMLPRNDRVWIMAMQTMGSDKAHEDFQGIVWSWFAP